MAHAAWVGSARYHLRAAFRKGIHRSGVRRHLFWQLPAASNAVALTFDDGPHPECTPQILDILGERGTPATFFVVGSHARQYPALVRRMVAEGHTVASHTDSHADLSRLGVRRTWDEMMRSRLLLEDLTGERVCHFRPPWGRMRLSTPLISIAAGMRLCLWSIDSRDHRGLMPDELLAHLELQSPGPGDIILFHDDGQNTADALPRVLTLLAERGLTQVAI